MSDSTIPANPRSDDELLADAASTMSKLCVDDVIVQGDRVIGTDRFGGRQWLAIAAYDGEFLARYAPFAGDDDNQFVLSVRRGEAPAARAALAEAGITGTDASNTPLIWEF